MTHPTTEVVTTRTPAGGYVINAFGEKFTANTHAYALSIQCRLERVIEAARASHRPTPQAKPRNDIADQIENAFSEPR